MPATPVKFYQVGSFAVGNRLLADDDRSVQSEPGDTRFRVRLPIKGPDGATSAASSDATGRAE